MICSSTNWRTISRIAFCSSVFSKNPVATAIERSYPLNFTRDVVESAQEQARALVERTRDGGRREWTFGELSEAARRFAGTLHARGARQGDVVLTLIGNRAEWAITMLACFRQGYVVLPCTEQLRAHDLALRLAVAQPRLVGADRRSAELLAGWSGDVMWVPFDDASHTAPPPAELAPGDPCLIAFTSGTSGAP